MLLAPAVFNVCCPFVLGQGNAQARLVADAMLDAVTDVLSQNTASSLTTVRIVIFQKPMLKDFHSSMQQREAADPDSKDKVGWSWGDIGSKIKGKWLNKVKCKYTEQRAFGFTFSNQFQMLSSNVVFEICYFSNVYWWKC